MTTAVTMNIQIRHRRTHAVLFEGEYGSLKRAVEAAVKAGANLAYADLAHTDLADAYLAGANLSHAYLEDAQNIPDGPQALGRPSPTCASRRPRHVRNACSAFVNAIPRCP